MKEIREAQKAGIDQLIEVNGKPIEIDGKKYLALLERDKENFKFVTLKIGEKKDIVNGTLIKSEQSKEEWIVKHSFEDVRGGVFMLTVIHAELKPAEEIPNQEGDPS